MNSNINSRHIVGYLGAPKLMYGEDETAKISKGFINVLFEEQEDGTLAKINETQFLTILRKCFLSMDFKMQKLGTIELLSGQRSFLITNTKKRAISPAM